MVESTINELTEIIIDLKNNPTPRSKHQIQCIQQVIDELADEL